MIIPLVTIALILPSVTTSTDAPTLNTTQAVLFAAATLGLYVIFILIQTGRHRDLFVHGPIEEHEVPDPTPREIGKWVVLLVAGALPIVLLSKSLDKVLKAEIELLGAPVALSGVLIAMIVFTPEGISALKAAYRNQLQRTVNLCLGACLSTLGLTLPAVLTIGLDHRRGRDPRRRPDRHGADRPDAAAERRHLLRPAARPCSRARCTCWSSSSTSCSSSARSPRACGRSRP